jgi:hypothetical protein
VSSASDILDPIELAQGEISRSKDVIASAAKELDQHDRWLKDFIAAEKRNRARHARWIRRKQATEHFRLKRQRMARSGKRAALYCAVFARSASRSSAKGLAYAGRQIWQCATWVGKNSYALSDVLLKMLSIGASWTSTKVRAVALASFRAVLVSVSWVAAKTKALTAVSLTMLATSFAWMWTNAGILARTARRGVSVSSSLFVVNGRALASQVSRLGQCIAQSSGGLGLLARCQGPCAGERISWRGFGWFRTHARQVSRLGQCIAQSSGGLGLLALGQGERLGDRIARRSGGRLRLDSGKDADLGAGVLRGGSERLFLGA